MALEKNESATINISADDLAALKKFCAEPNRGIVGEFAEIRNDFRAQASGEKDDEPERPNLFSKLCEQLVKHIRGKLDEATNIDESNLEKEVE